jgi:hypothetical protein
MRSLVSIRLVLLAFVLAVAHLVFASHVMAHSDASIGACEWCVCQGQTPAAPTPSADPVVVDKQPVSVHAAVKQDLSPQPGIQGYQSRAPPAAC